MSALGGGLSAFPSKFTLSSRVHGLRRKTGQLPVRETQGPSRYVGSVSCPHHTPAPVIVAGSPVGSVGACDAEDPDGGSGVDRCVLGTADVGDDVDQFAAGTSRPVGLLFPVFADPFTLAHSAAAAAGGLRVCVLVAADAGLEADDAYFGCGAASAGVPAAGGRVWLGGGGMGDPLGEQ